MKRALIIAAVAAAVAAALLLGFAAGRRLSRSIHARLESRRPGLTLTSPDIEDGGVLDEQLALPGSSSARKTPKLQWSHAPAGTVSFVLLLHDPDVAVNRTSEDATLWLAYNIPGNAAALPENPNDTEQIFGTIGPIAYHHYSFDLMALDTRLALQRNATGADVMNALNGHILAKGILAGRYHR